MKVFEQTNIAGMKLKNRIIRSATHEGMADANGSPLEKLKDIYVKLAKGGVGAIITGYVGIQQDGKSFSNMRMFDSDAYIDKYKEILGSVKEYGTPVILQIAHAGGKANREITGKDPVAPSRHKYELSKEYARELTEAEIYQIIDNFVLAIERAKKAGFDGVQLHAAHGYLLAEFLSPYLNGRKDKWGGSTENRFRIINEIFNRARNKVGDYPIIAKISAYDSLKNGMRIEESVKIAKLLEKCGCDAIEVSCGNDDFFLAVRPDKVPVDAIINFLPKFKNASNIKKKIFSFMIKAKIKLDKNIENYNVPAAQIIKESVKIPVIVVGGIKKYSAAKDIIENQKADFVSMCRPFIIEPNIVGKWESGKQEESRCINCDYCLMAVPEMPLKCYYGGR